MVWYFEDGVTNLLFPLDGATTSGRGLEITGGGVNVCTNGAKFGIGSGLISSTSSYKLVIKHGENAVRKFLG